MKEIWKDIPEYIGYYQASNLGRIKSVERFIIWKWGKLHVKEKILNQSMGNAGYFRVSLTIENKTYTKSVHRLVAQAFILNLNNSPEVNHKNGIKTDNRVENLEWCTSSHNSKESYRLGLKNENGIKNPNNKLNESQVYEIRSLNGVISKTEIANKFNVSIATISLIHSRKLWTHI